MDGLSIQRVKVASDGGSEDGLLVNQGTLLVAILVCLAETFYEGDQGRWHLEVGFGRCEMKMMTFETLERALRWIADCLGLDADRAIAPTLAQFSAHS